MLIVFYLTSITRIMKYVQIGDGSVHDGFALGIKTNINF